ncbi:MAG: hypothetical protein J0I09_12120 [Sphingobacteriia bacterium]|nr:hypothetical protein [Sphingobacteriia bacterium]
MKKIVAILLLAVLLFNWVGYRFIYNYFENRSEKAFQAILDKDDYNESDLVSIKVPLSLPYGPNSEKFEKVKGEVDINGISYQYVKRRFYKDSLELYCIPNHEKTGIKNARDEFFKMANDIVSLNTAKKSSNTNQHKAVKLSVDDFTKQNSFEDTYIALAFSLINFPHRASAIASQYLQAIDQPPETVAFINKQLI